MIDGVADSTVPRENHLVLPEFGNDEVLKVLIDYLKFYSYQIYHKKIMNLASFAAKTPFSMYLTEQSQVERNDPLEQYRRFG